MSKQGGNLTGREIAGYRLLHVLGTGGASEVYLGQRLDDPTALVAVKVLMPSWQLPPEERKNFHARFLREAQAAQRLHHPHILPVLVYGEEDGITFMVLPFMAGGTLATRLGNAPHGLPLATVAKYLEQIAGALDFAHEQGVIHRDIKPTNVLVDAKDQLYLSDFGIARLFAADESAISASGQPVTTLTVTGQILGTPLYMAPEQVLSAHVGPAADIYSLGILLYQMITGVVPFEAETPVGLAMLHVQEPPAAPHLRRVDLPPPAEAAILRAIAKSPEARFNSASELSRAFVAGLSGNWSEGLAPSSGTQGQAMSSNAPTVVATPLPTLVATPPPSSYSHGSTPQRYPAQRRRTKLFAVLGVLAILLLVGVVLGTQLIPSIAGGAISANSPTATTANTPTSTSSVVPLFQPNQRYTYNSAIGHSKANAQTNSDVSVVLVSFDLRGPTATASAVVSFYDADSEKSAHFLFQTLANVYLLDQNGVRYQAVSATPNEILMGPGQGGSIAVAFPPIGSDVSALYLYFNTDYQALDTPCITMTPTSAVAGCLSN